MDTKAKLVEDVVKAADEYERGEKCIGVMVDAVKALRAHDAAALGADRAVEAVLHSSPEGMKMVNAAIQKELEKPSDWLTVTGPDVLRVLDAVKVGTRARGMCKYGEPADMTDGEVRLYGVMPHFWWPKAVDGIRVTLTHLSVPRSAVPAALLAELGGETSKDEWPTSAETSAVAWPIDVMSGAEWNILDSTGTRIAICGYDNDHEKSGPRLAHAIVGMIRNLKSDNETLRREYEREDKAHEQTVKERDEREEALDAFVDAAGGIEVCGEHSNMNDPWANALREVQEAIAERDRLRKEYAEACERTRQLSPPTPSNDGDSLSKKQQAEAWEAVCNVMFEVDPDWCNRSAQSLTGCERACAAIRRLAKLASMASLDKPSTPPAPVTREEFEAFKQQTEARESSSGEKIAFAHEMIGNLRREVEALKTNSIPLAPPQAREPLHLPRDDESTPPSPTHASGLKPEQPLKWGCRIVKMPDGLFDVQTSDGSRWLAGGSSWMTYATERHFRIGSRESHADALAALDACTVAPPGWSEPTPKPARYEVSPGESCWRILVPGADLVTASVWYEANGGKNASHPIALAVAAALNATVPHE